MSDWNEGWNEGGGHRARHAEVDDLEVARHDKHFLAAAAIVAGEDVLDVGCGSGQTCGRLVLLVWQAADRNEWSTLAQGALGVPRSGPDPFSLADPDVVHTVLNEAGFGDVALTEVDEPVYFGRDAGEALSFVCGFADTKAALAVVGQDEGRRRLLSALCRRESPEGVLLGSRAWIVTGVGRHRSPGPDSLRVSRLPGPGLR